MGLDALILLLLTKQLNNVIKINPAIFFKFITLFILGYSCLVTIRYLANEINDTFILVWILGTMVAPWFAGLTVSLNLRRTIKRILGVSVGMLAASVPFIFILDRPNPDAQMIALICIMGGVNGSICFPVGQGLKKQKS